jgi:2',3'-cyclic-nucleotide 2'-phosphodiesterase (5'-nucleotidase family)
VGGILKRSHRLKGLRAKDPTTLYCDAGNFLLGNSEADTTQGKIVIAVSNELGMSVANISEAELEQGLEVFEARRREAKFDFISSNITANGKSLAPSHAVKQVKGLDIAFVGLCAPEKTMRSDSTKLPGGVQVKDPMEAAQQVIPSLSKKADLLVVLSTCGDATDSALAAAFPMINVIIGGRTYRSNAAKPWKVGNTTIARAQRDGRSLGRLEFEFAHDRTIKSVAAFEETMDSDAPSDAAMLAVVHKFLPDFAEESTESTLSKSKDSEKYPNKR